jgi:hypothetical protein
MVRRYATCRGDSRQSMLAAGVCVERWAEPEECLAAGVRSASGSRGSRASRGARDRIDEEWRTGWMNLRCGRGSVLGGGRASLPSVAGNAANATVGRAGCYWFFDSFGRRVRQSRHTEVDTPTGREKGRRRRRRRADADAARQTRLLDVSLRRPPTSAAAADADAVPRKAGLAEWPGQTDQTRVRRRNRR